MRMAIPIVFSLAIASPALTVPAIGEVIPPVSAVGFEDDFSGCGSQPAQQDVLAALTTQDGVFAPHVDGCVLVDYFATGQSAGYLDAVSLEFDLSSVGSLGASSVLQLWTYVRKGGYWDTSWHALRLYPGGFNPTDQDCDGGAGACWEPGDEFPGAAGWEGWVVRSVPVQWLDADQLSLTLRPWNARLDAVMLVVDSVATFPGRPMQADAYEDDFSGCGVGPVHEDVTSELTTVDGIYAPRLDSCVLVDYFANGFSAGYLDALAIHFEVPEPAPAALTLRLHLAKGSFDSSWHAFKVYPGLYATQDLACDAYRECWTAADEFPGTPGWEGVVDRVIPTQWLSSGGLDLTIRLWNAKVDAATLIVDAPTKAHQVSWGKLKQLYRK